MGWSVPTRSGRCSPRNDGRTRDSAALRAWRRSTSAGSTGYSGVRIIRPAARPPCGRAGARRRSARAARPRPSVRTSRAGETTGRERRDHRAPGWRLGLAHQWQQPREPSVAGVASRSAGWTSSGAALCSFGELRDVAAVACERGCLTAGGSRSVTQVRNSFHPDRVHRTPVSRRPAREYPTPRHPRY